jgi:putative spermidine/putrescine transport system permease protein
MSRLNWPFASRREPKERNAGTATLALPALIVLLLLFFLPLTGVLVLSVFDPTFTTRHYLQIFSTDTYRTVFQNTVLLSLVVTVACLIIGYPLAYWIARATPTVTGILLGLIMLPYLTSFLIRTYAWMVLLGRRGVVNALLGSAGLIDSPIRLLNTLSAVIIGMVYVLLPFTILILTSVMKGIDQNLYRAALALGASPSQTFWRVVVPLSAPGAAAAGFLTFVISMGFYITPALLGGPRDVTIAMLIENQVNYALNWGEAAAATTALLILALIFFAVSNRLVRLEDLLGAGYRVASTRLSPATGQRSAYTALIDAATIPARFVSARMSTSLSRLRSRNAPGWPTKVWSVTVLVLLLAPLVITVIISFSASQYLEFPPSGISLRWYRAYFASDSWVDSTIRSVWIAAATTILSCVLGTSAGIGLVRSGARASKLIYPLLLSPLIVPSIVTAVSLYFFFARLQLTGSAITIVLGHTIGAIPIVLLVVAASVQGIDVSFEHAAASLGASRFRTIFLITLPLIRPAILVSALLAFLHSFDELVIALFLSGPYSTTLPVKMWSGIREEITPTIASVSVLLIGVTLIFFALMALFHSIELRQQHRRKD